MEFFHENKFCYKLDVQQVSLSNWFNYSRNVSRLTRVTQSQNMEPDYTNTKIKKEKK